METPENRQADSRYRAHGVEVGILPVLQMGLLPLLSVLLSGRSVPNVTFDARDT